MTVSHLSSKLALVLAGVALAATSCADVGSSKPSSDNQFPVVRSTDKDVVICQSIRSAIQKDKKAEAEATAKGDKRQAALHNDNVMAGVEGAKSVKGCDVSDLVPAAQSAQPSASPS